MIQKVVNYLIFVTLISLLFSLNTSNSFAVESKDIFNKVDENIFSNLQCLPFAYADFNADKRIDIYCVADSGKQIQIWLARDEGLFSKPIEFYLKNKNTIVNLIPGDFNGDSIIDLLVTYMINEKQYGMSLFIEENIGKAQNKLDPSRELIIENYTIQDQPFAADFDGDGILDILVQTENDTLILSYKEDRFVSRSHRTSERKFYVGYAHSITDVNGDFKPDLVLTSKSVTPLDKRDGNIVFEVLLPSKSQPGTFELDDSYGVPDDSFVYGQSVFGDFDRDGLFEHLLPCCKDEQCKRSTIFVRKYAKNSTWIELNIDFGRYSFLPKKEAKEFYGETAISLKAGDYNLDGYLDLLAVLKHNNDTLGNDNGNYETYAVLLKNEYKKDGPFNQRTFELDTKIMSLSYVKNVVQASFFDLNDDGFLDILLAVKETPKDKPAVHRVIAFNNQLYDDVYFLKVMVIPGLCDDDCPYQNLPYGISYPGALVRIDTTSSEYERIQFYATQISQTSYLALQSPYVIIGLGSTPNFIEHLNVTILSHRVANNLLEGIYKDWTQIIPNSQLVINPNPRSTPYYWKMQLFITPSKNILMTAISLFSTLLCLAIIIGILQLKEKKEDEKERKLESQRFHFDGL